MHRCVGLRKSKCLMAGENRAARARGFRGDPPGLLRRPIVLARLTGDENGAGRPPMTVRGKPRQRV